MNVETTFGLYQVIEKRKRKEKANVSRNFVLPLELMNDWRNCSVVSDFVATEQSADSPNPGYTRNVLSSVTNELLENAVKYSFDRNKLVTLTFDTYSCYLTIETTNISVESEAKTLKKFVNNLENKDLDEFYYEQLEHSINSKKDTSGLGFLSLMKDYDANLGIKIEKRPTSLKKRSQRMYDVSVKVSLRKESLAMA